MLLGKFGTGEGLERRFFLNTLGNCYLILHHLWKRVALVRSFTVRASHWPVFGKRGKKPVWARVIICWDCKPEQPVVGSTTKESSHHSHIPLPTAALESGVFFSVSALLHSVSWWFISYLGIKCAILYNVQKKHMAFSAGIHMFFGNFTVYTWEGMVHLLLC